MPLLARLGRTDQGRDIWHPDCFMSCMKIITPRFWNAAVLATALLTPIAFAPTALRAQDHRATNTYHDKKHNDDHEWNGQEDRAYGAWTKETHRKNTDFSKLKNNDQQAYWGWRHEHDDTVLRIRL